MIPPIFFLSWKLFQLRMHPGVLVLIGSWFWHPDWFLIHTINIARFPLDSSSTCSTKSPTDIELPFYRTSIGRVSPRGEEGIRHGRSISPEIPIRVIDLHCIKTRSCLSSVSTNAANPTYKGRQVSIRRAKNIANCLWLNQTDPQIPGYFLSFYQLGLCSVSSYLNCLLASPLYKDNSAASYLY